MRLPRPSATRHPFYESLPAAATFAVSGVLPQRTHARAGPTLAIPLYRLVKLFDPWSGIDP
jgi:hypothetical protein